MTRTREPRSRQLVAIVISIAINGLILMGLIRAPAPQSVDLSSHSALQVVWIEPPPKPPTSPAPDEERPMPHRDAQRPVPEEERPARTALSVVEVVQRPIAPQVVDDAWEIAPQTSLPGPGIAERNILGNAPRPLAESPGQGNRMDLTFTDRSLGGTLQRMTKRSICSKLRRALQSNANSSAAILASMHRHGCN